MRLDVYLLKNKYFESRERAKKAVEDSRISVNGKTILKPSYDVSGDENILIIPSEKSEYVGRGGIKLEYALDYFKISVNGMRAIDIGASTGGFTDCLLKRGAVKVYAVDVGHGQLHKSLVADTRVVNLEGVNARELNADIVENKKVDIAVADLSFISQKLVIPSIENVLEAGGCLVTLIKPQFEVGRENIGKNGIVKSEKTRIRAVNDVIEFAQSIGYEFCGYVKSPIEGGSGNVEYLAYFKKLK